MMSAAEAAALMNGRLSGSAARFTAVSTDSRNIGRGELFGGCLRARRLGPGPLERDQDVGDQDVLRLGAASLRHGRTLGLGFRPASATEGEGCQDRRGRVQFHGISSKARRRYVPDRFQERKSGPGRLKGGGKSVYSCT